MNNIKCNTSAARSRYTLFLYQAPDHVASENNTHHHTLYLFFLKVNDDVHKYAQKQGAYRMTQGRSIFCSTPNAFCGYFGSWPFQTVQSFHCS